MRKLITLLSFSLFTVVFLHGQILFQEDFESGTVPAGWSVETAATDGGWQVGTPAAMSSDNFDIAGNGSSGIAATNDDGCNCNKSDEYFITPPIDLSDQTAVTLSFDAFYTDDSYQGNQEDATIEVSLDGTNWVVMEDLHGHGSWDRHTINLSGYAGEETVYVGFRYDDGGGWLYGFAIDNVVVEVPPLIEVSLAEVEHKIYGEVGVALPLKGVIYNGGVTTINTLEMSYSIDGENPVVETINDLDIPAFSYYDFELSAPWIPAASGVYMIEVKIISVNGETDANQEDNADSFESEIFESVIVPDKIADFLVATPVFSEIEGAAGSLNKPTDLDFFPILGKDELWVVNQRTENQGGSTLTISGASTETPSQFLERVDGNAWHFMSLPTGIAFSSDNFNFATSPGVQDANHGGGTFTGPTLWSSDPDIYAQPSGGNGSHLDMLHGSPFSMGIAHEVDNVFWVYDDWNEDIVRYDFVDDHGPGNDDHSDAIVRRYQNLGINADGDIPNHMILDKSTGWLYIVDNGNDRVLRLDINSGTVGNTLPLINEPLAEHSRMTGFNFETIIDTGLDQPCGIEIFESKLLVGDYANGDIVVYDMDSDFVELGRIATDEQGLTGIKIGPQGNIWFTNRLQNKLMKIEPSPVTNTSTLQETAPLKISPNPTNGLVNVNLPASEFGMENVIILRTVTGKECLKMVNVNQREELDLSHLPNGVYLLNYQRDSINSTTKIVIQR